MNNQFELSRIYKDDGSIIKEYYKEYNNKSYFLKVTKNKDNKIKLREVYYTELIPVDRNNTIFFTGETLREFLTDDEIKNKYNINKSTINNINDLYD
jgi:hypothetical protein